MLAAAFLLLQLAAAQLAAAGGGGGGGSEPPDEPPPVPRIEELTSLNFDRFVGNGSTWFVMLYAPWCGHCKATKPVLAEAAELYGANATMAFGQVDVTRELALMGRFVALSYPKFFMVTGRGSYFVFKRTRPALDAVTAFIDGGYTRAQDTETKWSSPLNPAGPVAAAAFYFHPLRLGLELLDTHVVSVEQPERRFSETAGLMPRPGNARPASWDDAEDGEWRPPLVPKDSVEASWYLTPAIWWNLAITLSFPWLLLMLWLLLVTVLCGLCCPKKPKPARPKRLSKVGKHCLTSCSHCPRRLKQRLSLRSVCLPACLLVQGGEADRGGAQGRAGRAPGPDGRGRA
eukprot:SAG22_NODE_134_length_18372_cov_33.054944_2_plen_345_part_00